MIAICAPISHSCNSGCDFNPKVEASAPNIEDTPWRVEWSDCSTSFLSDGGMIMWYLYVMTQSIVHTSFSL